jgi:hypothetical protein
MPYVWTVVWGLNECQYMKQETPLKLIYLKPLFCDLYSAKRSHTEHNYSQDSSINVCVCVCVCIYIYILHAHIPFVGQTYQDWWWCDSLFGRQVPVLQENAIPSRWKQNVPLKCWYLCAKITWNYIIEDYNLNSYHHESFRCHKQTQLNW